MNGNINRAHLALRFLLMLGIFVMLWGFVGPSATGATFSDALVERLDLPRDPETYSKIAKIYADSESQRAPVALVLGLLIVVPAVVGMTGANRNT